jgi:hypothetical protein
VFMLVVVASWPVLVNAITPYAIEEAYHTDAILFWVHFTLVWLICFGAAFGMGNRAEISFAGFKLRRVYVICVASVAFLWPGIVQVLLLGFSDEVGYRQHEYKTALQTWMAQYAAADDYFAAIGGTCQRTAHAGTAEMKCTITSVYKGASPRVLLLEPSRLSLEYLVPEHRKRKFSSTFLRSVPFAALQVPGGEAKKVVVATRGVPVVLELVLGAEACAYLISAPGRPVPKDGFPARIYLSLADLGAERPGAEAKLSSDLASFGRWELSARDLVALSELC